MKNTAFVGGESLEHVRHDHDFYQTPVECTLALMKHRLDLRGMWSIWEPACGDGAISTVLERYCRNVVNTDYRLTFVPGLRVQDFLTTTTLPLGVQCIVTNPPFSNAEAFIRKARSFNVPFAMLLKSTYWNSARRRALFVETGPVAVLPLTWRPVMAADRGDAPTLEFQWTVWNAAPSTNCYFYPLAKPVVA